MTIVAVALCARSGVALARAGGKRLRSVVVRLRPLFAGNLLSVAGVFIQGYHFLTGARATVPSYPLTPVLPVASVAVFVYGATRLLRVIQATPASGAEALPGGASVPGREDAWPPPPNSPGARHPPWGANRRKRG